MDIYKYMCMYWNCFVELWMHLHKHIITSWLLHSLMLLLLFSLHLWGRKLWKWLSSYANHTEMKWSVFAKSPELVTILPILKTFTVCAPANTFCFTCRFSSTVCHFVQDGRRNSQPSLFRIAGMQLRTRIRDTVCYRGDGGRQSAAGCGDETQTLNSNGADHTGVMNRLRI